MIYDKFTELTDDRIISALIGMPKAKFTALAKNFESASLEVDRERVLNGEIKHVKQGGPKGYSDSPEKKLFFILFYLKTYPTFDVLGFHFGLSGGHAHAHVDKLLPVLSRALSNLNLMPLRQAADSAEFRQALEKYKHIAIDGVECPCVRPQDDTAQEEHYSGKKKTHGESHRHFRP